MACIQKRIRNFCLYSRMGRWLGTNVVWMIRADTCQSNGNAEYCQFEKHRIHKSINKARYFVLERFNISMAVCCLPFYNINVLSTKNRNTVRMAGFCWLMLFSYCCVEFFSVVCSAGKTCLSCLRCPFPCPAKPERQRVRSLPGCREAALYSPEIVWYGRAYHCCNRCRSRLSESMILFIPKLF